MMSCLISQLRFFFKIPSHKNLNILYQPHFIMMKTENSNTNLKINQQVEPRFAKLLVHYSNIQYSPQLNNVITFNFETQ